MALQEASPPTRERSAPSGGGPFTFAYSGDPDDAFAFYGLATGAVRAPTDRPVCYLSSTIQDLNERAIEGVHEVSAISSAAYPLMAGRYFISSVGASVGRNYGPMLASRRFRNPEELRGRKIGSPGPLTTGHLLLMHLVPGCQPVFLPFEEIRSAILNGDVDAGVLIHEELLNYREFGLSKVRCLGEAWFEETGLPLPVGLNVIRRDLGRRGAVSVTEALRRSLQYARDHESLALEHALGYSIAVKDGFAESFIGKFANEDTVCMDEATQTALGQLLDISCDLHGLPPLQEVDII